MADAQKAYDALIRHSRERSVLASCSALLSWDEQTYLPRGGASSRGDQMALLAGLHHDRATDSTLEDLLAAVEESDLVADANSPTAANVRQWRRSFDRLRRLPRTLVADLARVTTLAQGVWVEARRANDFGAFRSSLAAIIALKRQEGACLAEPGRDPYDALLDEYEPGARGADLARLFEALRVELVPLVATIAGSNRPAPALPAGDYPVANQRIFGETVAAALGFDFERGRLDTTAHPFCSGIAPGDCRITTRFDPTDFTDGFFSILHEVGHGLYEQGVAADHAGTPMGEAVSLGVHESQSRLWENGVGRSRAFWEYWLPFARRIFREPLHATRLDAFYATVNRVEPSLIRVQADEATYNLHILIRFELEQALIAGDLLVGDLPTAWNAKYRAFLGINPPDDARGCLQDIHWAAGLIGYFPTYTLGNLYAAQLRDRADADLGGLDATIRRGEFAPLLDWLRTRIHRQGQRFSAETLIEQATGASLDHRPLIRSLRAKYAPLYGLAESALSSP